MDYIIFKDIDSRIIKGLMICKLPPITKARKRVLETTIDGLDGSIIEDLGYETYDKELEIGLKGNFNIDEIISYFNGEGNIVFSNEPDKYYKVSIIDQINYEKLLRFRKAVIKLRTQPFKYLYGETYQKFDDSPSGKTLVVTNEGFEKSKPIITLKGSGTLEFKLEDKTIFTYTFPTDETDVTIDSEKQDAYVGATLKNRNMIGEFPIFKSGKNNIIVTGDVTEITVIANSRWL